jgi:cell wall-associated NlpC family hydrolase
LDPSEGSSPLMVRATTWDCSSFTQAAYAHIGFKMPAPPPRNPAGWPPVTAPASRWTFSYATGASHHIFEIWRVRNVVDRS